MISLIFYLICNFFLLLIIIRFLYIFFPKADINKTKIIAASILFYITTSLASNLVSEPLVNLIVNFCGIFAISIAFGSTIKKKILISFALILINAASDIIAYLLFAPKSGEDGFNASFIYTILILIICERIIKRIFRDKSHWEIMPTKGFVLVIIPIVSLLIIHSSWLELTVDSYLIITAFGILIINLIVFHLYHLIEKNYIKAFQNIELSERVKAYSNEMELMKKSNEQVKALRHDIHHHIIEMKGLLKKNDNIGINDYLDCMRDAIDSSEEYVNSGNYEMDSLLNYLLQNANEILETVDIQIAVPKNLPINNFKFNTVIGNLVKNAIEAASLSSEKMMKIEIEYDRGVIFISIANSFDESRQSKGKLETTKKNKDMHGIGLKNVKRVVQEMQGSINIKVEDGIFLVKIMLFIDNL